MDNTNVNADFARPAPNSLCPGYMSRYTRFSSNDSTSSVIKLAPESCGYFSAEVTNWGKTETNTMFEYFSLWKNCLIKCVSFYGDFDLCVVLISLSLSLYLILENRLIN